ncbi:hypothetical protein T4D_9787 [Trichinella pseudospiralis]|uniref:Uncharacterized protein n=1 Tax=Trichinella pseudospiralis TaxID=6337 RepID=A0A0V1DLU3_TRIPS|nr:hypothetical protein T4D_9787 [Trichinella pseudospiralis]
MGQRRREWPTNDWPNLRLNHIGERQPLEAPPRSQWKEIQRPTTKH